MNKQLTNKKKQTLQPVKSYMKRVTLSAMVLSSLVGVTLPSIVNAQEQNNKTLEQQEQVAVKQVKASTVTSDDTTIEPLDLKKVAAEIKEKKLRETVELTPVVEEFLTKGVDKIVTKGLDLEKTILNIEHEKPEPVEEVIEEVVEPVVEEVAEPVYEEPVYEEPVYEEPVYVEPVVEEPVYEEPVQATSGTHMRVQATMYSQHEAGLSNMTAAGYNLNETPNIIAVNPSIIPFGSVVEIVGVGTYIAGDTGGFTSWGGDYTTGIDIHTNDLSQAHAFGKRFVDIIVYQPGQYPRRSLVDNTSEEQAVIPVTGDTKTESVLAEEEVHEMPVEEVHEMPVEEVHEMPVEEVHEMPVEEVHEMPVVEYPIPVVPEIELSVKDIPPMVLVRSYVNKINELVSEEPVLEEDYEEPVIEEDYEEPVIEEVSEEPVIEEVSEEPVIEEVSEEPVIEEVSEEPVIEEVYEEPVIEEVSEEPVNTGGGLISIAESVIGTPYVWGGKTPAGFDCSGFINYVYKQAYGMDLGSWTGAQQYAGQLISVDEAQAGDLYFWGTYGGDTSHVALATGGGSYIHASQPGTALGYGSTQWYTPQFAIRVL